MNNAIYGKCIENLEKRADEKLVNTEKQLKKWTENPNCKDIRVFDENLVGIELQ